MKTKIKLGEFDKALPAPLEQYSGTLQKELRATAEALDALRPKWWQVLFRRCFSWLFPAKRRQTTSVSAEILSGEYKAIYLKKDIEEARKRMQARTEAWLRHDPQFVKELDARLPVEGKVDPRQDTFNALDALRQAQS